MMDRELYYVFAIVALLFFIGTYTLIRDIIWSIAMCDIGVTTLTSMELKKNKNFSMSYLSNYITTHKKQYMFWMKVKRLYVVTELIWLLMYLLLPLTICNLIYPFYINFAQAVICFFVIQFQFDFSRNTKYDRIRLGKFKK